LLLSGTFWFSARNSARSKFLISVPERANGNVLPHIFNLRANRKYNLRRAVEMAEEFPHVKINALDIGTWGGAHPAIIPCSYLQIPMQFRSPLEPLQRTWTLNFRTLPSRRGFPTRLSISSTPDTAVFSLYGTPFPARNILRVSHTNALD
jgi:hypothetical protein